MKNWKEKNKKVLVTGAGGYIGSRLVQRLQTSGVDYLAVDKISSSATISCLNLQERQPTLDCFVRFKPDVIVHLATHSALAYQHQFLNSFRDDAQVLFNLLEGIDALPGCRLIYFSSSYVYSGLDPERVLTEESPLKPQHSFGIAKAFFEQLLLKCHPESIIFRLFSVFGPGNYLFPNLVHNMVKECQETGKVTVWGEGTRKMQYVFVQDVLASLEESLFLHPGIYNVGGNDYLETAEAAKIIAETFNGDLLFLREKPEGETLPFGENRKIKRACGKDLFTPFATAIQEYKK